MKIKNLMMSMVLVASMALVNTQTQATDAAFWLDYDRVVASEVVDKSAEFKRLKNAFKDLKTTQFMTLFDQLKESGSDVLHVRGGVAGLAEHIERVIIPAFRESFQVLNAKGLDGWRDTAEKPSFKLSLFNGLHNAALGTMTWAALTLMESGIALNFDASASNPVAALYVNIADSFLEESGKKDVLLAACFKKLNEDFSTPSTDGASRGFDRARFERTRGSAHGYASGSGFQHDLSGTVVFDVQPGTQLGLNIHDGVELYLAGDGVKPLRETLAALQAQIRACRDTQGDMSAAELEERFIRLEAALRELSVRAPAELAVEGEREVVRRQIQAMGLQLNTLSARTVEVPTVTTQSWIPVAFSSVATTMAACSMVAELGFESALEPSSMAILSAVVVGSWMLAKIGCWIARC